MMQTLQKPMIAIERQETITGKPASSKYSGEEQVEAEVTAPSTEQYTRFI